MMLLTNQMNKKTNIVSLEIQTFPPMLSTMVGRIAVASRISIGLHTKVYIRDIYCLVRIPPISIYHPIMVYFYFFWHIAFSKYIQLVCMNRRFCWTAQSCLKTYFSQKNQSHIFKNIFLLLKNERVSSSSIMLIIYLIIVSCYHRIFLRLCRLKTQTEEPLPCPPIIILVKFSTRFAQTGRRRCAHFASSTSPWQCRSCTGHINRKTT